MMNINELSESQHQFHELIKPYPRLAALWNWNNKELDIKAFEKAIKLMSKGEKTLACFFASIWLCNNMGFDLLDAAELDASERKLIANWLINPVWP